MGQAGREYKRVDRHELRAVIDDLHVLIPFRLHCYMHAYLKRCSKNSSSSH